MHEYVYPSAERDGHWAPYTLYNKFPRVRSESVCLFVCVRVEGLAHFAIWTVWPGPSPSV
jgi:hypothetical protein